MLKKVGQRAAEAESHKEPEMRPSGFKLVRACSSLVTKPALQSRSYVTRWPPPQDSIRDEHKRLVRGRAVREGVVADRHANACVARSWRR